ncbi:MAG TPA: pyruvate ferredoxin oxidoreductase [bacterium (Candidatus Stahlbacteria)]|nr:pyruvate ferredoxin oxidoreductase [Candidatus Stahlbacteria bacterium]
MTEIRVCGFGGQGIIRAGYIIGKATSLFEEKHATLTQSFGPEARGGACSAQVVVDTERVLYPYVTHPNVLIAMSQEALEKYEPEMSEDGVLLLDEDLVRPTKVRENIRSYAVPATRIAEELGRRIVANLVMLGFFTAITGIVSYEAMKKAIPGSVPERALELNLKAFERGYDYGLDILKKQKKPQAAEQKED